MRIALLVLVTANAASAAPPPKDCGASLTIRKGDPEKTQITGTVKAITPSKDDANRFEIAVTTASGERTFQLYIAPAKPPFAVGDKIDANLRRGGGWHQVYDGLIKDGSGRVLLIISGSGADDLADGWKVSRGAITESRQNPNMTEQSVNRTHALVVARGKTSVTVPPHKCTLVKDGADSFIVSGFGNTWIGARPPEGIDYQTFAMIRWAN